MVSTGQKPKSTNSEMKEKAAEAVKAPHAKRGRKPKNAIKTIASNQPSTSTSCSAKADDAQSTSKTPMKRARRQHSKNIEPSSTSSRRMLPSRRTKTNEFSHFYGFDSDDSDSDYEEVPIPDIYVRKFYYAEEVVQEGSRERLDAGKNQYQNDHSNAKGHKSSIQKDSQLNHSGSTDMPDWNDDIQHPSTSSDIHILQSDSMSSIGGEQINLKANGEDLEEDQQQTVGRRIPKKTVKSSKKPSRRALPPRQAKTNNFTKFFPINLEDSDSDSDHNKQKSTPEYLPETESEFGDELSEFVEDANFDESEQFGYEHVQMENAEKKVEKERTDQLTDLALAYNGRLMSYGTDFPVVSESLINENEQTQNNDVDFDGIFPVEQFEAQDYAYIPLINEEKVQNGRFSETIDVMKTEQTETPSVFATFSDGEHFPKEEGKSQTIDQEKASESWNFEARNPKEEVIRAGCEDMPGTSQGSTQSHSDSLGYCIRLPEHTGFVGVKEVVFGIQNLGSLRPEIWFEDPIIDFMLQYYAIKNMSREQWHSIWLPSCQFFNILTGDQNGKPLYFFDKMLQTTNETHLLHNCNNHMQSESSGVDLFKKEIFIIPVHVNHHWVLVLVINPIGAFDDHGLLERGNKPCTIYVFDSLKDQNRQRSDVKRWERQRHIKHVLTEWLRKAGEVQLLVGVFDAHRINVLEPINVPFQDNSYDCGPFVCFFAEKLMQSLDYVLNANLQLNWNDICGQAPSPNIRQDIVNCILENSDSKTRKVLALQLGLREVFHETE